MQQLRRVVGSGSVNESWGPALREFGLDYKAIQNPEELSQAKADCFLIDVRESGWAKSISKLKAKVQNIPIITLVSDTADQVFLKDLRVQGSQGYISAKTPPEEVAIRIRAMLREEPARAKESRAAKRIWFQEEVEFSIFKQAHKAWSTTLSESGVFLRTTLSFPLYSTIRIKFQIPGETRPFECDGVIVRQEVEGDVRGIGIMFQGLKGESVRQLESFLEIYR